MQPGSEVFFDNLFTSFPLLEELSLRQTAGTGTVRQNRLNKIPIKSKKELEARAVPRGTMDVVYKEDVVLVGWKDSKAVYMASNKYGAEVKKTCKRFNRQEKKEVQVPMPEMFDHYNKEMGGVDYLDIRQHGGCLQSPLQSEEMVVALLHLELVSECCQCVEAQDEDH